VGRKDFFRIFLKLLKKMGSSPIWLVDHTHLLVARAKEQAPKTKRAGIKPSPFPPSSFPQRDAGGKG
jgi:hypothetical protein